MRALSTLGRHRFRLFVELVAIGAAQVAAPHDHELGQERSVQAAIEDAHAGV